jgi:4-amino-4-deoxy-L-arabinose transferase-like glycosyltransferase
VRYLHGLDWDTFARASIILGAAIRAAWVLVLHSPLDHIYSDMKTYVATAMNVAQLVSPERFDAFYPPGTRVLLAIPLALIGPDRDGLTAAAVLWTALSALTPYFMWRFLRLLLPPAAAALGAAFCALWPLHIAYAGFFLSETPALAFLVLSLWLAEQSVRALSTRHGLLAGLAGGVAAAIRPALALNVILAAVPLARRARVGLAPLAALAAGSALVLALVVAHQALVVGRVVGVSENSGLTFYLGHCNVRLVTTGRPETLTFQFQTPVATQLERGEDVSFPDQQVWDQDFFYAQGMRCIADDGLAHARVILRNIYDMGLSTIPWPPSNDEGLKQVVQFTNVGYVLVLPFIVFGTVQKIRRSWPAGGGRGELMLLGQLSLALVTAIVYFGDPRFRTPFDVFGLALAASLLADRIAPTPLGQTAAADPGIRADDAVEQHDERALDGTEPAREVDPHDPRPAESDRGALVGADDGAPDETRWGEARRTRADEVLSLVDPVVHEIAPVGPDAVEPERSNDLETHFGPQVLPIGKDAPDARVRHEESRGAARHGHEAREEVDPTPVEER